MKLTEQIERDAAKFGIVVEWESKGVCLCAPVGYCFDTDLHFLVSSQWDYEPMLNVYRGVLKDITNYGPHIQKCEDNCACKE